MPQAKEFTFRSLFAGLAAFCAVGVALNFFSIFAETPLPAISEGVLAACRTEVEKAFSPEEVRFEPGEDPYGGALGPSAADRVTLVSEGWEAVPLRERQLTVLYFSYGTSRRSGWEALRLLSPSGERLTLRGGVFPGDAKRFPPDENRRVWLVKYVAGSAIYTPEYFLVYYDGGNEAVNAALERLLGKPEVDGRAEDPPASGTVLGRFLAWDRAGDFAEGVLLAFVGVFILVLAVRPAAKDPAAAGRWLASRLEKQGVPIAPYGRTSEGPFGKFPGEEAFSAYLPAYSAGDIRKGEREAGRQGKTAFPENLLAVSFFPSAGKAKKAAAMVAPSGDRLKAGSLRLPYAPSRRLYRKDTMLLYYAGPDRKLAEALGSCCGKPFAGSGLPPAGRKD